jgi:hypothetical protein
MKYLPIIALLFCFVACKKETTPTQTEPKLIFKFVLDSTQTRLNNLGIPAGVKTGNAAQSPQFNAIAAHYIELAPTAFTQLGKGAIVYKGLETTKGGSTAILFDSLKSVKSGEAFYSIPLSKVQIGNYEWLRVSLAYQNYNVRLKYTFQNQAYFLNGTIASFIGFNSYLSNIKAKDKSVAVNANKKQGFWAYEIPAQAPLLANPLSAQGDAAGTTVVNPIANSSPIPAGSCVVTGSFEQILNITGKETKDIIVTVSLSTNKSFEWEDTKKDGYFEPGAGEKVVDMGVRGMKVKY